RQAGRAGGSHGERDLVSSRRPRCGGRPSREGTGMAAPTRRVVGLALLTWAIGLAIVAVTILPGAATPAVNLTSTTLARGTDQSNGTLTFQRGTDVVVAMNTFAAATATTPPGSSGW